MAMIPGSSTAQRHHRRSRQERLWLLVVCLVLASVLALFRAQAWQQARQDEEARLQALAAAAEVNLARRLDAVYAVLDGVRRDRGQWSNGDMAMGAAQRMRALKEAMPGVRQLALLGAQGQVLASSGDPAEVLQHLPPAYVDEQVQSAGPAGLRIHVPGNWPGPPDAQAEPTAVSALAGLPVLDAAGGDTDAGRVEGAMVALLEAEYFMSVLQPLLYAPDMVALLIHSGGLLLAQTPPAPSRIGVDLNTPQSLFTRHREGGGGASVQLAVAQVSRVERLAALQDLSPRQTELDQPLVLALSRSPEAVMAGWQRQTGLQVLSFGLLAALAWGVLLWQQRKRARLALHEAQAERQQALQAERLTLALAGADLALFDTDLQHHRTVVNARWFEMLGHEDGAFDPYTGWAPRVHPDDLLGAQATQQAHQEGRTPGFETTYRMRHAQGHWVWVLARGRVVERDADGRALRLVGTHMDVTERMQAQEALRRSEQSLAITLSSIGDAVIATDTAGTVTRMNPAAERLTGWTLAEAQGLPLAQVFRIFNARTREPVPDPVALVLAQGEIVGLANDTVLVARDGSERQIADSAAPIRGPQAEGRPAAAGAAGDILGVVLVFSDVTEQYRMMQALRDRERQFASVAEAMPGPVSRVDGQGRYLYANRMYEAWFGMAPGDIIGRTHREVLGEAHWAQVAHHLQRALAGEAVRYESPVARPGRQRMHVLVNLVPDLDEQGQPAGFFTIVTDITERKHAEDELRRSEARVRALLDALSSGVVVHAPDTAVLQANPAASRILGLSVEQMMGKLAIDPAWHFVEEDGSPMVHERYPVQQLARSGQPVRNFIGGLMRPDRSRPLWVLCNGFSVPAIDGSIEQLVVTFTDITERKEAEDGLREAQQALQATLEAVPDLLFEVDLDGLILNQHSPRNDLLMQAPEQFLGRLVRDVLPADAASVVMYALRQAHEQGRSIGQQYSLQLPLGLRSFELSVSSKPTPAGQRPRFIALARDISERQRADDERQALERQLREVQRLESIGTLAGGIAHDFNNILAAILGNVALAQGDLPAGHAALASLEQIQRAGQRARSLVQQILTFSRRGAQTLSVQPLRAVVEETLGLLKATLPASVRVHTQLADAPLPVRADASQLPQVLMNLCTNAWHALPEEGGHIEVGLQALPAGDLRRAALAGQQGIVGLQPLPDGDCAHLWVRDDGTGMDAATLQRIFDPFFTTKPVGQGTGLGLSVVHGIVNTLHGALRLESTPGQGSSFHVFLPLATVDAPAGLADVPLIPSTGVDAGGRVLYVDDDEVMVLMVQRLLQRAGYQVLASSDPQQALALLQDPSVVVDLLVTDFNMPDMSGLELCRRTRSLRPALPMIISSGYISERLRTEADDLAVSALLKKEDTLEELPALVQRLLPRPGDAEGAS